MTPRRRTRTERIADDILVVATFLSLPLALIVAALVYWIA